MDREQAHPYCSLMTSKLALIGFGEAGSTFAQAAGWKKKARAFDIRAVDYAKSEVFGCDSIYDAVAAGSVVISVVTADAALDVAKQAALHITRDVLYFDMNSVSPGTKREAAVLIETAGGRYVDTAIMAPVDPLGLGVPLLVSGPHAQAGQSTLAELGFSDVKIAGDEVGRASTIKMLRSVMYKGVEALTAECLLACERAGVTDEVLRSFGNDWSSSADYRLDRMLVHGERRAAEMRESAKTLAELGIEPMMTSGTAKRQAQLGALGLKQPPNGLHAKLEKLTK